MYTHVTKLYLNMKLEMKSVSRFQFRVYDRPVSLACRRDKNIGNNVTQREASTRR